MVRSLPANGARDMGKLPWDRDLIGWQKDLRPDMQMTFLGHTSTLHRRAVSHLSGHSDKTKPVSR